MNIRLHLYEEAPWVWETSPHTNLPKTAFCRLIRSGRAATEIGGRYCIVGEGNQRSVGHVSVTGLRSVDVRHGLSHSDAQACGYRSLREFLMVWAWRHDPHLYDQYLLTAKSAQAERIIKAQPFNKYLAWLVSFTPVMH